ncbi:lipase [Microbacterium nanhaiense]|uniref:Lipase n=1 Tax=Microbacterium nanhaiense TaxID=1301026 RepID=A0ABQ2N1H2_9MICO|nr:SGNH/GDSL hydrolase family protein [Microbacterium nanhaiense]GGO63172.1 lipase [Microbacterium nanhaiense]
MTARLVFVGDSITDSHRDRDDARSLGDGYVAQIAAELPEAEIVNVGISGNRAVDLEARWATDVVPTSPDVLTIYIGINDTWRRFDRDDATSAEDFEASLRRLLDTEVVRGARVILVEPFLLPVTADQRGWIEDLDAKRAVVDGLASEIGAGLVPLHSLLTAAAGADPASIAPDGVHPSAQGARLIADAWLEVYRSA